MRSKSPARFPGPGRESDGYRVAVRWPDAIARSRHNAHRRCYGDHQPDARVRRSGCACPGIVWAHSDTGRLRLRASSTTRRSFEHDIMVVGGRTAS